MNMADAHRRLVVTSDDLGMTLAVNRGIEAALRHGHPGMAAEYEEILETWDE